METEQGIEWMIEPRPTLGSLDDEIRLHLKIAGHLEARNP
jgi:hypothetical protein